MVTWHVVTRVMRTGHVHGHVTQLTSILHQLHDGDAVLVSLEHPGAVLHVVDPASDRQVSAARVERLGCHDDLQDHARVTLKCLTQHLTLFRGRDIDINRVYQEPTFRS